MNKTNLHENSLQFNFLKSEQNNLTYSDGFCISALAAFPG